MADGSRSGLPSSNRGVSRSGREALANAAASIARSWAGLDWVAGSVDLLQLLELQGWDAGGAGGEGIAAHLAAYGPKPKPKTPEADENGELVLGKREAFVPPDQVTNAIALAAFGYLLGDSGLVLAADASPGKFYAYRYMVTNVHGEPAGMLELGGTLTLRKNGRPSLRFELTGLGCGVYEQRGDASADHAQRWCALRAQLERVSAVLSRADIAYDDFDGVRALTVAHCMYQVGEFDYRFAGELHRPKARGFEDHGSGDGCSFYVGHSSSEKQLRVYEKGKQLGDPDSPWVRWEVQLRSSSRRKLTLDVLTNPEAYARGAFDCLDFISRNVARLLVSRQATKATLKSVLRHAKRMYGSTLGHLARAAPDRESMHELVEFLAAVEKPPGWAKTGRLDWEDVLALIQSQPTEQSDER